MTNRLSAAVGQETLLYSAVERIRRVMRWIRAEQELLQSVLQVSRYFASTDIITLLTLTRHGAGQCRDYQCVAPDAIGPGVTCIANSDCILLRDSCVDGICTDVGTSCTAIDGSSTGVSDTCDAGTST